jgi:hypothetical protein
MTDKRIAPAPEIGLPPTHAGKDEANEMRSFLRRAGTFVLVGLILYLGVYLGAEWLVYETAERNRFFTVKTAQQDNYDHVILGASHAAVFDYRDMNTRLEEMTGARILNLASEGSGVTVNRIFLEYFYASGRETDTVVYVVDSFAFYSPQWNEVRLQDTELYTRAPFDPTLARILLTDRAGRPAFLDYVTGFSKINNADRFEPDLFEAEGSRFDRAYRPVPQIDRQRIGFLYPDDIDTATLESSPYFQEFEELIAQVRARGDRFIIVRPPMPDRIYEMLPNEQDFDRVIQAMADRLGAEVQDFISVNNDLEYFYDSDHLNQVGTLQFFEHYLQDILTVTSSPGR